MYLNSNRSIFGASSSQKLATRNVQTSGFWDSLFGSSDFGDSPDHAENVGKLKRGKSYNYSGDVGRNDLDFFRFKVSQKRNPFSAKLTNDRNNAAPIAISVLNKRGRVVKSANQFLFRNIEVGETAALSMQKLRKGTYYFRIQSAVGSNEEYDVEFSLSALSTSPFDQSLNIGQLTTDRTYRYTGYVGKSDIDFYKFNIERTSRVSASLFNNSFRNSFSGFHDDSIAISILDNRQQTIRTTSGRYLFVNVNPYQEEMLFDPTLPPGEYYIRIQSDLGENLGYQLELERSSLFATPVFA